MKVNGVEFINDNWSFLAGNNASYLKKFKVSSLKGTYELTLGITTKRDRITPFNVFFVEHNSLPIQIAKCEDFYFLTDEELKDYILKKINSRIEYMHTFMYLLEFLS